MVSATQSHSKLSAKAKGKQRESPATGPAGATAKTTSKPSTPSKADTTSSIKHEQEQAKATKKPTKKPEKSKVRRVHVSGLPAISEDEVRSRFKSFGNVLKVDGLGKMDGNGNPLRYAFIDIDITKSKLAQCMNLLSGSIWKGSTLRIADARPSFLEKLERERKAAAAKAAKETASSSEAAGTGQDLGLTSTTTSKKRKRDKTEGVESENMELVNKDNVKAKEGWKLDPTTSTPVFPIIARPDHPLPPLPIKESAKKASASSSVKDAKKLKKEGQKDKKVKDTLPPEPPNRARRVKIDSTQWKPSHAREEDLVKRYGDTIPRPATALSLQEQEEAGSDSNAESSSTSDGTLSEDDDDDDDDDSEAIEPLTEEPGKIKLDQDNAGDDASDSEDSQESEGPDATLATDIESTVKEDSDESKAERQRLLAIAASFATQPPAVPLENAIDRADAEGDASLSEESESEEDEVEPVARDATASSLQPPIGDSEDVEDQVSEAEEEEVQDEQENHEGRSDDDASSADNDADMADASSTNPRVGMANVQMQSLTDMFRPQESAAGFSLGNLLDDFELDELPEGESDAAPIPFTSFTRPVSQFASAGAGETYAQASSSTHAAYDPHEPLFFPFPLEEDEKPGGILHNMSSTEKEALLERSWTGRSAFKRFKRTQTIAEITTIHENLRKTLSEQVRKRHREAVKRRKRTGGRSDRRFANDNDA